MSTLRSTEHATLAGPDALSVELIRDRLDTTTVAYQIYLFWEVPSTNGAMRELASAGARHGTVVLAESQTAGRGRLGKPWFSPPGVNLHASVLFRPALVARAVPVFSFMASLALTDAIWAEGIAAGVKWPNDILVAGRKTAGTLVSSAIAGDRVEWVILGVGVNVNVTRSALEAGIGELATSATSLQEAAGRAISRNALAAHYLNAIEHWSTIYAVDGADAILSAWRERDVLTGRRVEVRGDGAPYAGWVLGVDGEGRLRVAEAEGTQRAVGAGEVVVLP